MTDAAFYDLILQVTVITCATLVLIVVMWIIHRNKQQKQITLQKLIESGQQLSPEILESLNLTTKSRPQQDFRKGILLVVSGVIMTTIFKLMGGFGWVFGFVPLCFVLSFACFVVFVFLLAGVEHQAQPFAEFKRQELLAMFSVLVTVLLIWLSEHIEVFN